MYPANGADTRNPMLKVTDPRLLETTGGIVQGMSGSPILQNGKLVGAVTHVWSMIPPRATAFWRRICSWRRKMGETVVTVVKRSNEVRRNTHKLPEKPLRLLSDYGKL